MAAEDTSVTTHSPFEIPGFHQEGAADLFSVINTAGSEVVTRERPQLVDNRHTAGSAVKIGGFGAEVLIGCLDGFKYSLAEISRLRHGDPPMAANGNGL